MIRRELIANLKSFIIWTSILVGMFLFVYLIYPYIITEETMQSMNELMQAFPEDVLKAFNMDMSSLSSVYGWFKSEGLVFVILALGVYSSILGGNILLKEEKDKTIEYLSFLPIKRSDILTKKIISSLIYILSMIMLFTAFNFVALLISEEFDIGEFFLLCLGGLLISLPFYFLNLFLSTILRKNANMLLISLGLTFVFYIINVVSQITENVEALKYFSLFSLADTRGVIETGSINVVCIFASIGISVLFACLSYVMYNKKELV